MNSNKSVISHAGNSEVGDAATKKTLPTKTIKDSKKLSTAVTVGGKKAVSAGRYSEASSLADRAALDQSNNDTRN